MPLHSIGFIALFLPLSVLLYFVLGKTGHGRVALAGLIGTSLWFAGWRAFFDAELLLLSIVANFLFGLTIHRCSHKHGIIRTVLLTGGVFMNLGVLVYFKYSTFILENLNLAGDTVSSFVASSLPLGISFLTFQQIAYLVDVSRGRVTTFRFLEYCVFCSFFPKLLAGPITRYEEFAPQIVKAMHSLSTLAFAEGVTLFAIGLTKKVVLADTLAGYANPIFAADSSGRQLGMVEAWGGIFAYSFQLYFDFSGYTDMALGVARLFGFTLPQNFNSPYKATNIIDFWQRWHMTLSRFLRDYLYIPLGGNRKGVFRQQVHIFITMMLCGLWHGANWTFVIWGALHGLYLLINHGWRRLGMHCSPMMGWMVTFLSTAMAWVWFRAESIPAATRITASLLGINGFWAQGFRDTLHHLEKPAAQFHSVAQFFSLDDMRIAFSFDRWTVYPVNVLFSEPVLHTFWLAVSGIVALRLPNTREWMTTDHQSLEASLTMRRAVLIGALLFMVLLASMTSHPGGFIYENF